MDVVILNIDRENLESWKKFMKRMPEKIQEMNSSLDAYKYLDKSIE